MEINVKYQGVETNFLIFGEVKVCKKTGTSPVSFLVTGDIADVECFKVGYPYIAGGLVLFSGIEQEAHYLCDRINQLGGVSSHEAYMDLMREIETLREE